MHLTQSIRRAAQVRPEGAATIFRGRKVTWSGFADRVARFAGFLRSLGLEQDARVAILAKNSDRYLECYYAIPWADCILVPINTRWSLAEQEYALRDSGSSALVVDQHFIEQAALLRERVSSIRELVYCGDGSPPSGMFSYEELAASASKCPDAFRRDGQIAGIFYTGGTTGSPKGVMTSHKGHQFLSVALLSQLGINEQTIALHVAPMFHLGFSSLALPTSAAAGTHVILPQFDPQAYLTAVQNNSVTHIFLVPTMIKMLLDCPTFDEFDLGSVRRVLYAASPISEALLGRVLAKMPNAGFIQSYGLTESASSVTILGIEAHREGANAQLRRSVGRAMPGTEVMVVDDRHQEVPRGAVGEIAVRTPAVMLGYWQKPDLTARATFDGWLLTGDAGYMDENAYLFLKDRVKDMIITGGENVYSAEVENALAEHAAVSECAVIGIPHEKWGETVHAVVVLKDGREVATEELISFCRSKIAAYKCPRSVEIRPTPLPLSPTGKVLKTELRMPFWQGQARNIN